jgi:hypothetical protein
MDKLKKSTTDLMNLGIGGMVGLGAMGAIGSLPGMPAESKGVQKIAGTGVQLGMIGGLLNVTKNIIPMDEPVKKKKTKKKVK